MNTFESNIPSVYQIDNDKELITADLTTSSLTHELNPINECWLSIEKQKELNYNLAKLEKVCDNQNRQIDATIFLLNLQSKLEINEEFDDIDLVYDPKIEKYRFRLFDQNDLTIPIDLDFSETHNPELWTTKIQKIWEIIVNLMNNIDNLYTEEEEWNIEFEYLNWLRIVKAKKWEWMMDYLKLDEVIVTTDTLKDIFEFDIRWWDKKDELANAELWKIMHVIKKWKLFRDQLKDKWIKVMWKK